MNQRALSVTPTQQVAKAAPVAGSLFRRRCACGQYTLEGQCPSCKGDKNPLQRKPAFANQAAEVPASVQQALSSPGQPLDAARRAFFEPRLGQDFSQVRLHTDTQAAQSARAVNALAYTVGQDVAFAPGQYAPGTLHGTHLIAHELAHVAQQTSASSAATQPARTVSDPSDPAEAEADHAAEQIMNGGRVTISQLPSAAIHVLSEEAGWGLGIGGGLLAIGAGLTIAGLAGAFDKKRFSQAELNDYLTFLRKNKRIEDKRDSDNKARDVVGKDLFKDLELPVRILLIEEMLSGVTGDDDEDAILAILTAASPKERVSMADKIGLDRLHDKIDGAQLNTLYALFPELNSLYPRGAKQRNTYSIEQYIDKWEKEHGHKMTEEEKKTLGRGCVGISALTMEDLGNPDLSNCYDTFAQVLEAAKTMNAFLEANRPDKKAIIFSKRFWSGEKESFKPDPKTGKVDMSEDNNDPRPKVGNYDPVNFDYGLYDEKTGNWWHANHCSFPLTGNPNCAAFEEPNMKVYESNLQSYSKPLIDFDRQVFCVAVGVR